MKFGRTIESVFIKVFFVEEIVNVERDVALFESLIGKFFEYFGGRLGRKDAVFFFEKRRRGVDDVIVKEVRKRYVYCVIGRESKSLNGYYIRREGRRVCCST